MKMKPREDLELFSAIDPCEREQIRKLAIKKMYRKNDYIFKEDDPSNSIYLIKHGRVRVFKSSFEGKEFTLDFFNEKDILGESIFFENARHTMNAVAMEDTIIYCWSKQLFASLLQNPKISLKIVQYLAEKADNYTEYMSHFVLKDVRGRIISLLDRLAEEYGNPSPLGLTISINLTHQDIGNLINASRVMVTNVLNELRKENMVHIDRQRITLLSHNLPCDSSLKPYERI